MDAFGTPLAFAVTKASPSEVRLTLHSMIDVRDYIDAPDPKLRITPLVLCGFRDDDVAAQIATMLMDAGARVDTMDSAGCWPLFMAAQEGKPALARALIERGATLDKVAGGGRTTTAVWIAAQNGHAPVVAAVLSGAADHGLLAALVDKPNAGGKTPACVAAELAHAAVVGALFACGADLGRASPALYHEFNADRSLTHTFDPDPRRFPTHAALDVAMRSHIGHLLSRTLA